MIANKIRSNVANNKCRGDFLKPNGCQNTCLYQLPSFAIVFSAKYSVTAMAARNIENGV